MNRKCLFLTALFFCLFFSFNVSAQQNKKQLPSRPAPKQRPQHGVQTTRQQDRSVEKTMPLTAGYEWTYRMQVPKEGMLIYDPYYIDGVMTGTSITNGFKRGPIDLTFTIKSVEALPDSSAKIEWGEDAKRLWFAVRTDEERLVVSRRGKYFTLELHGYKENGWILKTMLALLPIQGRYEEPGYMAEPLTKAIRVAAGEFSRGSHSIIAKPESTYTPAYRIESWTAEGVGLLKYVVHDATQRSICTLELLSYQKK